LILGAAFGRTSRWTATALRLYDLGTQGGRGHHLAVYECAAYIPDMSCEDSKRTPGLKKPVGVKMIDAIHTNQGHRSASGGKGTRSVGSLTGASGDGVGHAGTPAVARTISAPC